ncbi:hypothetical protein NL393_35725, partial [Klebsiella pneumoniae]|nr:hypothetical protein [Klebsiella pneumoniae]
RERLEQALAHGFAQLELPDVDHGWLWHEAQRRDMSWLEAGMQNFDAQEPVKLYLSRNAAPALAIDSSRFVRVVRNLDLGGLYQAHL